LGNLCFWAVKGVFARTNAQVLKWVRQKLGKIRRNLQKWARFEQKLTKMKAFLAFAF